MFVLEGEDGELGGESVLDGIEASAGFASFGARTGGVLRIALAGSALGFG
ncbi:MAG: hypothetical protein K2X03_00455 [Bryobacteraceae bacterium]|nr:hypothetical protein [Bryobacteraceae bacterium]